METSKLTLYQLTEQMTAIESALEENGGELTPELESLWEETGASLTAKADNYNALIRKWEGASEVLANEIKRLQSLKKTVDNSIKGTREHVKDVMERFGIQRIDGALCKMYLTESTSTEVNEEEAIRPYADVLMDAVGKLPSWLSLEFKISKKELAAQYKNNEDGLAPAGVSFNKNKSLTIK